MFAISITSTQPAKVMRSLLDGSALTEQGPASEADGSALKLALRNSRWLSSRYRMRP